MKSFLLLAAAFMAFAHSAVAQLADPALLRDSEIVQAFKSLPIQEGGRVKPLDTYARFLLLRIHGKQSIAVEHAQLPGVKKLSAIEWLLLSWFRPDIARDLPLFVVDNSQAVGEIGVDPKGLRDRYSWNEVVKGKEKLVQLAESYSEIKNEERTAVHRNVIDLARNFFDFDAVSDFMTAARTDWKAEIAKIVPPETAKELTGEGTLSVWDVAQRLGTVIRADKMASLGGQESSNRILQLFIDTTLRPGKTLAFIPPEDKQNAAWLTVEQAVTKVMQGGIKGEPGAPDDALTAGDLRRASAKDALLAASAKAETFKPAVQAFVKDIRDQAAARGDLKHVDREVRFYKADYFTNALVFYLLGFLIGILGLIAPGTGWSKWAGRLAALALVCGIGYNVWGIVQRCLINERPPIATLYETVLFITACIAVVGLVIEFITRRGVGLTVGGFIGALGMFLSMRFMALDGQDTMPTLEAVLITNFWLATHVTCINVGYAGAMLASVVSMVYVGVRALAGRDPEMAGLLRLLTRITYGMVCFGLLFALVGTVLGGIWANDSWGRFWGWDPKENGALMIVLMCLVILHARLGGYIREPGLHFCSLILGSITLFSWWGVNQLSIGLHTYGFTAGISLALNIAYSIQWFLAAICLWFAWSDRRARLKVSTREEAGVKGAPALPRSA